MEVNKKIMIQEMSDKWHVIYQSLTPGQIKSNSYSIDLIKKNLATIEATENGIINQIEWYEYINLSWDIRKEFFNLEDSLNNDYLLKYEYYLNNFEKNLNLYLSCLYEDKLQELASKFDKLSLTNQSAIRQIHYQLWIIKKTAYSFLNFCQDVGLVNHERLNVANDNYSEVLVNLSELKLMLVDQELAIYELEHFYVHDFGTSKIKPN